MYSKHIINVVEIDWWKYIILTIVVICCRQLVYKNKYYLLVSFIKLSQNCLPIKFSKTVLDVLF